MNPMMLFLSAFLFALSASAQNFTVGTQNLYHWMKDYDARIARMKSEVDSGIPEIMAFQEAARWKSGKSLFDKFMEITSFLPHHRVTNSFGIMQEGIGFGSKLPGQNCQDFELPKTTINSRQWINICDFPTALGLIKVINAHTSPGPWAEAVERRTAQMRFMTDYLIRTKPTIPVLVVGDLNDEYASVSFDGLKELGYIDVLGGEGATYDSENNPYAKYSRVARLDYIFYHPGQLHLVKADFMFKQNIISDHWGLKAEFSALPGKITARKTPLAKPKRLLDSADFTVH